MTQQKQRKQLHLTDDKNIFTYCFQSIQRLQPNFDLCHKKFHVYQAQQRQSKIKDIPFHTATTTYTTQYYESYTPNNKQNKQTKQTQTIKTTRLTWVSPLTQSLCFYNWDNANSGVFIFKFQPISKNSYSTNFIYLIHHQFAHFINLEKHVHGLMNSFVHFIHPYMNPLPKFINKRVRLFTHQTMCQDEKLLVRHNKVAK